MVMMESRWEACEVWAAERGRPARYLSADVLGPRWSLRIASWLEDGSLAFALESESSLADQLLHVAADGRVLGRRVLSWDHEGRVGLVSEGGALGLVRSDPDRSDLWTRYGLDASEPARPFPLLDAPLAPCANARRAGPGTLLVENLGLVADLPYGGEITRAEIGSDGACWREIIVTAARPGDAPAMGVGTILWVHAEGGEARAEAVTSEGLVPAPCQPFRREEDE